MKKAIRVISMAAVFIVVIVGIYLFITERSQTSVDDVVDVSEIQKIITRNLDTNYPETPREVVKLYSRIIVCYYDGGYTDAEFNQLVDHARALLDEQLLENNPREEYLRNLKAEIEEYGETSKRITTWRVSKTSDINYENIKGYDYAYVPASYYLTSTDFFGFAKQTYELRKNEDGRWKILAFYKTEEEETNE